MMKSKKMWRLLLSLLIMFSFLVLTMILLKTNVFDKKNEKEVINEEVINEEVINDISIIEEDESKKLPMRLEENLTYKVYYGSIDDSIINDLLLYNMVIIEPTHITDEDLIKLQETGVMVIGYQSLLEVGLWDGDILDNLNVDDILIEQTEEKGPTADPTSEHYRSLWGGIYEERIINRGFDGVFLDTIDHVTLFDDEQRNQVIEGTVSWIEEMNLEFPEMLIIQNRGFDVFLQGTALIVDGLLWENFDSTRMVDDENYAKLVKDIDEYSQLYGARIMGLNRLHNVENMDFCIEYKWLHAYVPSGTYSKYYYMDQTIDWIYKGIIDEDWVLSKEKWFVEEGALDSSILYRAQQMGIKMYLIVDIGAMDTTETYIQDDFLSKIENASEMGYEGILFEGTKNWYNISTNDSPSRIEIYEGYTKLLEKIQTNIPEMGLYQYEGIMVINPEAEKYLDGFVWTDFANSLYSDSEWQQLQIEKLSLINKEENWDVYIFSGDQPEAVRLYCIDNNYIYIQ